MITRLLQLASPALPVGAYTFSEGLEQAVEAGWVRSEADTGDWVGGLLRHVFARLDVPVFARLHDAWCADDEPRARAHSAWLLASRESAELRASDRAMGQALARVLAGLGVEAGRRWVRSPQCTFAAMFALAVAGWDLGRRDGARALAWTWAEHQVAAAIKLVPLGQSAGQRLLFELGRAIPHACDEGLALADGDIGGAALGLAIASARHETQHTRLFRS